MESQTMCKGCGEPLCQSAGTKPRSWCSEACRVRTYYRTHPDKKIEQQARGRERARQKASELATTRTEILILDCTECGAAFVQRRRPAVRRVCSNRCRNRRNQRQLGPEGRAAKRKRYRQNHPEKWAWTESKKAWTQRRRARKRGADAERVLSAEIFDRDGWRCGLCGGQVDRRLSYPDPMSASLDHILPLSIGGAHTRANVQLAHLVCNTRKNNRPHSDQLRLIG